MDTTSPATPVVAQNTTANGPAVVPPRWAEVIKPTIPPPDAPLPNGTLDYSAIQPQHIDAYMDDAGAVIHPSQAQKPSGAASPITPIQPLPPEMPMPQVNPAEMTTIQYTTASETPQPQEPSSQMPDSTPVLSSDINSEQNNSGTLSDIAKRKKEAAQAKLEQDKEVLSLDEKRVAGFDAAIRILGLGPEQSIDLLADAYASDKPLKIFLDELTTS